MPILRVIKGNTRCAFDSPSLELEGRYKSRTKRMTKSETDHNLYFAQASTTNRQGLLNDFFSVSAGTGAAEPRKQQVYKSRRLQDLVTEHRKEQARKRAQEGESSSEPKAKKSRGKGKVTGSSRAAPSASTSSTSVGSEGEEPQEQPVVKKRKKASARSGETARGARGGSRARGERGRGAKSSSSRARKSKATDLAAASTSNAADDGEFVAALPSDVPVREIALRARVRPRPAFRGAQAEGGSEAADTSTKNGEVSLNSDLDSGSDGSEYQDA